MKVPFQGKRNLQKKQRPGVGVCPNGQQIGKDIGKGKRANQGETVLPPSKRPGGFNASPKLGSIRG